MTARRIRAEMRSTTITMATIKVPFRMSRMATGSSARISRGFLRQTLGNGYPLLLAPRQGIGTLPDTIEQAHMVQTP
jgi:hypothetical protein